MQRRTVYIGVAVMVLVVLVVLHERQTGGYSRVHDVVTFPLHLLQSGSTTEAATVPSITDISKYEGEDEMMTILSNRLAEFSMETVNLQKLLCSDAQKADEHCYDTNCTGQFSLSPRDRLRQVLATRIPTPRPYLDVMTSLTSGIMPHKYVFVTALSSNHYHEMQGLVLSMQQALFPRLSNFTFVLFDLGMTPFQRYVTERNCNCTVLDFPFPQLPPFVRHLTCYSWKPIAVASLLEKAEYLVWTDASIRWQNSPWLDTVFQRAAQRGVQCINDFGSLAVRTTNSMFQFYGDQQCQYAPFPEMLSGFELFHLDRLTREAVLKPWLACAFDQRCMCVPDSIRLFACRSTPPRRYGRCHRYDQSSLGIILSKLYVDHRPIVYLPKGFVRVAREEKLDWFQPTKTDMILCVFAICFLLNMSALFLALLCRWRGKSDLCGMEILSARVFVKVLLVELAVVLYIMWVFVGIL